MGPAPPDRSTQRNGYRHRDLDTRVGTIDVAITKLRSGTCFPEGLLERRNRAESAMITVVSSFTFGDRLANDVRGGSGRRLPGLARFQSDLSVL